MAVYDDIRGWDPLPYLAQEFYLEYGDFDYSVTVPANWIVAGSGELVNAGRGADPGAAGAARPSAQQRQDGDDPSGLRDRRHGHRHPHLAFPDAQQPRRRLRRVARVHVGRGADEPPRRPHSGLAMSVYPPEAKAWDRSTEYLKDAVERFSAKWYPFPWPNAVNVAGPAGGMEYPALAFDDIDSPPKVTFWVAAHEIGHSWFPMTVGFNERRDAWMDEGFNTFIDVYELDEFNHGEYAPKRDSEYAPKGGNPVDEILPILADPDAPPILSRADTVVEKYRHSVTYFKSALGLVLLREQILGPERFDPAFRAFTAAWAFKHPTPADFFRFMDSYTGEDLSWWWNGWYAHNWQLDLAVAGIKPFPDKNPLKGSFVTVEARDRLVMPVTLRVTFANGASRDMKLPAETWIRQASTDVPVVGNSPVVRAVLDPDHKIPDRDRTNNEVGTH